MSTFVQTIAPTPFGFFDADPAFQGEADSTITFVKRKLGDDVLQVELTKKQIWACLEEATCEYGKLVNEVQIKGELANILGAPTGSSGSAGYENRYLHKTLEFLMRQADPYASYAGVGGSFDSVLGYFQLEAGRQDYNLYTELMHPTSGTTVAQSMPSGSRGKLRIIEVFHADPIAAQHMLLNASNATNFLANEFNFESYTNSTVFYVLPVFEDVLRRQMLETAARVRRSNYSYEIRGSNVRIFPIPAVRSFDAYGNRLWVRVSGPENPLNTAFSAFDDSTYGVSGPSNAPYGNIPYGTINSWGRQWIRQYTMALARELLGLVRSKMKSIPVPGGDLTLNGDDLVSQGREDKDKLRTELREFLDSVSQSKLIEQEAAIAENIARQLKFIPMPLGRAIFVG